MAKQTINIGTSPNKGDGDPLRTSFTKINSNFDELYALTGGTAAELEEISQDYAAAMFTHANHTNITATYDDDNDQILLSTSGAAGIALTDLSVTSLAAAGSGTLTYDNITGIFQYTPPDLSTYITTETNDLTSAVTWANVPDINITESSVTQHQAALSITESQISDLGSYITLADLSVSADATASGSGGLAYNNSTGVFTYTPPDLSSYIELADLSVGAPAAASGSGAIAYDVFTGVFTYTPPDVLGNFSVVSNPASGNGTLTYTDSTGVFTYTPPDLSSYLTSYTETNDLTASVTWTNVPPANITETAVTQHQGAILITESQITNLGNYTTLSSFSITNNPPPIGGTGSLTYNNSTGVFTFEPADVEGGIDAHLNTSTATTGQVLSWTGTDYDWVAQSGGGTSNAITQGDSAVTVTDTGSDGNIEFKTENTARWDITSAGHFIPTANATYDIGSAEFKVRHFYLSNNSLKFVDDSDPQNPVEYPVGMSADNRLTFNSTSIKTTSFADAPVGGPIDITVTNHFIVPGQNYTLADGTYIGQELKLWRNPGSGFNDITVANAIWTNGALTTATATTFTWRLEELSTGMYSCIWNGTGWILANGSIGA